MLVFFVGFLHLKPESRTRPRVLRPKKPIASRKGKIAEKIMVDTIVFAMTLNQVWSKSPSRPPVKPNEKGCSLRSALTSSKRNAVLKNCT